ncbi:MAG: hypothetical protein BWZ10_02060 [candidate division BRC1 bacterium ADurb.BinA364]|nr:MAG: hypothetical protein BWZ10_02060 [candidate division BRC1 bacterium ADurb.BinA364]
MKIRPRKIVESPQREIHCRRNGVEPDQIAIAEQLRGFAPVRTLADASLLRRPAGQQRRGRHQGSASQKQRRAVQSAKRKQNPRAGGHGDRRSERSERPKIGEVLLPPRPHELHADRIEQRNGGRQGGAGPGDQRPQHPDRHSLAEQPQQHVDRAAGGQAGAQHMGAAPRAVGGHSPQRLREEARDQRRADHGRKHRLIDAAVEFQPTHPVQAQQRQRAIKKENDGA